MAVVRIFNPARGTVGWQARWQIPGTRRRLTRYFADSHGASYERACKAEAHLRRRAMRMG